jgi:hypothetical protein
MSTKGESRGGEQSTRTMHTLFQILSQYWEARTRIDVMNLLLVNIYNWHTNLPASFAPKRTHNGVTRSGIIVPG